MTEPIMVCEKCHLIFNAKFQVNGKQLLYTRRELRLKEDCPLCTYFARSLGPLACDGNEVRSQLYQWFYPSQDPRKDVLRYGLSVRPFHSHRSGMMLTFEIDI
jgi:hypothetical protein